MGNELDDSSPVYSSTALPDSDFDASPTPPLWLKGLAIVLPLVVLLVCNRSQLDQSLWLIEHPQSTQLAPPNCVTVLSDRSLSPAAVKRLQQVAVRTKRSDVEALLGEAYCQIPALEVRNGVAVERFLYRQQGSESWVLVAYEGDEYLGTAVKPFRSPQN